MAARRPHRATYMRQAARRAAVATRALAARVNLWTVRRTGKGGRLPRHQQIWPKAERRDCSPMSRQ